MIWILGACMGVCWLGMVSSLRDISQQSRERDIQRNIQRRITATSWTPYHPKKGKYRHTRP